MSGWMRNRVVQAVLPGFVVEHWPDVLLLDYRFDSKRDEVWSVSMWINEWVSGWMRNRVVQAVLPGFVVEHWPDVLHLDHRYDC
jgi:hypothetical protein